ncbi:MAG: hypothetical protein QW567_03280 [Candidatus Hadarchaeales archaeon]
MSSSIDFLKKINWFGLALGIIMIAFGVLAPAWWRITFGGEAVALEISPFNVNMSALGTSLASTLVSFVCIAARISVLISGVLLLLGSVSTGRWWSRKLVNQGALKLMWMVISLVVLAVAGSVVAGYFVNQMAGESGIQLSVPVLSGSTTVVVQQGPVTISAPFVMELTGAFFVAVAAAVLGVLTRLYQRRLMPAEKTVKKGAQGD